MLVVKLAVFIYENVALIVVSKKNNEACVLPFITLILGLSSDWICHSFMRGICVVQ